MWASLLFRGCVKEWGTKTLLRWLLNIAAILHWSLKPILHSLEQWTSRLRLPPSHQGDIIYIMRRCHGNKAPISMGVVSHGGWIPRCLPNMRFWCAGGRSAANAVTHARTQRYVVSQRERVRTERHTWLENKGWEGNSKWAVLWGGVVTEVCPMCLCTVCVCAEVGNCEHAVWTLHTFGVGIFWCTPVSCTFETWCVTYACSTQSHNSWRFYSFNHKVTACYCMFF